MQDSGTDGHDRGVGAGRVEPRRPRPALLAAAWLATLAAAQPAGAVSEEGALWTTLHLALPVSPRLSAHLIVQPRFDADVSRLQRVVVRPWLEAGLGRGFAAALGYDAHVIENPVSTLEQRVWQQLSFGRAWRPLRGFARLRLEERFLEGSDPVAWRSRLLVGLGAPLGRSFELVAQDELFVNLNQTRRVARTGVRENRLYAGFGRPLRDRLRADLGYQLQWQELPGADRMFHTLMLGLRFDAPGFP
jgi:hypothetical protein